MAHTDEDYIALKNALYEIGERVNRMELSLSELDKKTSINDVILSRVEAAFNKSTDAWTKNSEAISSIEKTMVGMQSQIVSNAEITKKIETKVGIIEKMFNDAEDKAKIDFRLVFKDFVRDKLMYLIGGGLLLTILQIIVEYLKK